MKQALVIVNPKWEPYSEARDAFKLVKLKDNDTVLLVVRGVTKERKGHAIKVFHKNKPDCKEALAVDLRKAGISPQQIEAELKTSKLPSMADLLKKAAALLIIGWLCNATAQQNIIGLMNNPATPAATTNTTAGNGFIGLNIDQVAVFQWAVATTNNATTTETVRLWLDTSDNGTDWVVKQYPITSNTNSALITKITNSVGGKYVRIGNFENSSTNTIVTQRLTVSTKPMEQR